MVDRTEWSEGCSLTSLYMDDLLGVLLFFVTIQRGLKKYSFFTKKPGKGEFFAVLCQATASFKNQSRVKLQ
jgi:hypothetical protein